MSISRRLFSLYAGHVQGEGVHHAKTSIMSISRRFLLQYANVMASIMSISSRLFSELASGRPA